MGRVIQEGHCTIVIAEKNGGDGGRQAKFLEEKVEPDHFLARFAHCNIFSYV